MSLPGDRSELGRSAVCGAREMRHGRHYAEFTLGPDVGWVGVVGPTKDGQDDDLPGWENSGELACKHEAGFST